MNISGSVTHKPCQTTKAEPLLETKANNHGCLVRERTQKWEVNFGEQSPVDPGVRMLTCLLQQRLLVTMSSGRDIPCSPIPSRDVAAASPAALVNTATFNQGQMPLCDIWWCCLLEKHTKVIVRVFFYHGLWQHSPISCKKSYINQIINLKNFWMFSFLCFSRPEVTAVLSFS